MHIDLDNNMFTVVDALEQAIRTKLDTEATDVRAADLNLDSRIGSVWVGPNYIAVVDSNNRRRLDYYGGFEYVDADCIKIVGDVVFYFDEDERVAEAIAVYTRFHKFDME